MDLAEVVALSDAFSVEYLEHHAVLPVRREDGDVLVATWLDAVDVQVLDDLRDAFGCGIRMVRQPEQAVRTAIRRVYGEGNTARDVIAGIGGGAEVTSLDEVPLDDLLHQANEALVVRLVNLLLLEALDAGASDIHLESYPQSFRVRYRLDGVLQDVPSPPAHLAPAVVSRLKIMADLDIAERRHPQDGRIRLRLRDRQVDVRVSIVPALHGESVVLRLLDKERGRASLEDIGMAAETLQTFARVISRPHGIVLSTGPTGSGKTTTLYAAIDCIRTGREKILTVEDPVEYELPGVPQIPVNEKVGVTFASVLRALLRQDPDVLLVGEIRDEETAEIATHAALTGHLVLSTLHTNDAPGALTRLLDLGVPSYIVASTVEAVLAQRLVRLLCSECRDYEPATEERLRLLGEEHPDVSRLPVGRGCEQCRGTGYRGRTGIYELLVLDEDLRAELGQHRGTRELRRMARTAGMRTLREDALRLVRAGATSIEEVLRVTYE